MFKKKKIIDPEYEFAKIKMNELTCAYLRIEDMVIEAYAILSALRIAPNDIEKSALLSKLSDTKKKLLNRMGRYDDLREECKKINISKFSNIDGFRNRLEINSNDVLIEAFKKRIRNRL